MNRFPIHPLYQLIYLQKEIKKYCTVAIGGDGADELFGGYKAIKTSSSINL